MAILWSTQHRTTSPFANLIFHSGTGKEDGVAVLGDVDDGEDVLAYPVGVDAVEGRLFWRVPGSWRSGLGCRRARR